MRLVNRLLAAVLSLALIAGGVLVIVEVIGELVGQGPVLWDWGASERWADRTTWQSGIVRLICVILLVLGLLLLAAELKPSRVRRLRAAPVPSGDTGSAGASPIDPAYTRRGVATAVRAAVTDVDGIRSARVTVKRRKVKIKAATASWDRSTTQQLSQAAREAALRRLEHLQLKSSPSVSIRTRSV